MKTATLTRHKVALTGPELHTGLVMLTTEVNWIVEIGGQKCTATRAASCLLRPSVGDTVLCARVDQSHYIVAILTTTHEAIRQYDLANNTHLRADDTHLSLHAEHVVVHGTQTTTVQTEALQLQATQATIKLATLSYQGERIDSDVGHLRAHYHLLEQDIATSQLRAKLVLESIAELKHQVLGDMQIVVREGYRLSSSTVNIYADDDVRVQGKQINLS